jgi:hypothetical protein
MLQNVNFKIQPPAMFPFFTSVSLKVVHILKIYQNTIFHGPALTGANFTSTSNVCYFGMVAATVFKIMASRSPSMV